MPTLLLTPFRSLVTVPTGAGWRESAWVAAAALVVIGAIAGLSGLLEVQPVWHWTSLLAFLVPGLTEELVFRGFLPSRGDGTRPLPWIAASVVAFTLWHVVEALTFLPGAEQFLTPGFLLAAAALGLACAIMRYRTGSLWPAVVFHGAVVLGWTSLFGGPTFAELTAPT